MSILLTWTNSPHISGMPTTPMTSDDVAKALDSYTTAEQRVALLRAQTAALGEAATQARSDMRDAFLASKSVKYAAFPYKDALLGDANATFDITILGDVYSVRPPSGDVNRAIEVAFTKPIDGVAAPTQSEVVVMAWVVRVTRSGNAQNVGALEPVVRLKAYRALTAMIIEKLANECLTLESWLSAKLEIELGN